MRSQDRTQIGVIGQYLSARREHFDKFDTLIDLYTTAPPTVATRWILVALLPKLRIQESLAAIQLLSWADALFGGDRTQAFKKKCASKCRQMKKEIPASEPGSSAQRNEGSISRHRTELVPRPLIRGPFQFSQPVLLQARVGLRNAGLHMPSRH